MGLEIDSRFTIDDSIEMGNEGAVCTYAFIESLCGFESVIEDSSLIAAEVEGKLSISTKMAF